VTAKWTDEHVPVTLGHHSNVELADATPGKVDLRGSWESNASTYWALINRPNHREDRLKLLVDLLELGRLGGADQKQSECGNYQQQH
jgi:hypothetical protein